MIMVTVVRTLNKTSFISLVLVLLGAWSQTAPISIWYNSETLTLPQRLGLTRPPQTVAQSLGLAKPSTTLADVVITPQFLGGAFALVTSYGLVSAWSKYRELKKEKYLKLLDLVSHNRQMIKDLIKDPLSEQYTITKRIALNEPLINFIHSLEEQPYDKIDSKKFKNNLKQDVDSFPLVTYFLPELLRQKITNLKNDLGLILAYANKFDLEQIELDINNFNRGYTSHANRVKSENTANTNYPVVSNPTNSSRNRPEQQAKQSFTDWAKRQAIDYLFRAPAAPAPRTPEVVN